MSRIHVGSYGPQHGGRGHGVVTLDWDRQRGSLGKPMHAVLTDSPAYLTLSGTRRTVYAAHECDEGRVTALRQGRGGVLEPIGTSYTGGRGPCHVFGGRGHLVVSHYPDGTVALLPLDADEQIDGVPSVLDLNLGTLIAHPHGAVPLPQLAGVRANLILIPDLGRDALICCEIRENLLQVVSVSPTPVGSGPRAVVFGAPGDLFVADELGSTVSRYRFRRGRHDFQFVTAVRSTLTKGANHPAHVALSADGKYLYVSNRGADTIAVFDTFDGSLSMVAEVAAGGSWPQHFALEHDFLYVANQNSDRLTVHRVDVRTGIPTSIEQQVDVRSPSFVLPVRL